MAITVRLNSNRMDNTGHWHIPLQEVDGFVPDDGSGLAATFLELGKHFGGGRGFERSDGSFD